MAFGADVPVWIYWVEAAAAAASVASGVVGVNNAHYQEDVAEQNAIANKHEASSIAEIQSSEGRKDAGRATALAAASGLTVDGSAAGVIGSLAAAGEYNARSALYQGLRRDGQFIVDKQNASDSATASVISAAGSAASGILTAGRYTSSIKSAPGSTSRWGTDEFDANSVSRY